MTIANVHERTLPVPAEQVGALLDRLGSDDDPLWPSPAWVPMRFDGPLAVGADGGHGPIRYHVSEYEPGRRVRLTFRRSVGIDGYHEFEVEPLGPTACRLRHVVAGRTRRAMRVWWPLAVRWLHDAVLEDLLDNAERAVTGRVRHPARWSPWVRLWRHAELPRPRAVAVPRGAELARAALPHVDLSDAYEVPLHPGATTDPRVWAAAIFRDPPRWVVALLRLRNALVGVIGVERSDQSAFDTVAVTERASGGGEVLLGTDAGHLDFRASVLVDTSHEHPAVTLTTIVRLRNLRGRLYLAVVRHVHPVVVRAMLRRAARRLAIRTAGAEIRGSARRR